MKKIIFSILCTVLLSAFCLSDLTGQTAAEPAILTSCGQSPGPIKLKIFLTRLGVAYDYNLMATAADLVSKKESGTPYSTLIIVTGASLKGMGAAGVSVDDELERTAELIAEARKQGIKIIGAHIEGMARRSAGADPGDNSDELSIDAVCPNADFMIVMKEGDSDGRFTAISKGKNIPLIMFEKNSEISSVLEKVFSK
ncbi:MAG: DUF6305 family protein [Marinilabiliaceae bacterium]|jgi:hypothetical protein|nr:DUF6305 family protein [Marinilabiliaceae bacterium]